MLLRAHFYSILPQFALNSLLFTEVGSEDADLKEMGALIDGGADPDLGDILQAAAIYSSPEAVKLLLERGAKTNIDEALKFAKLKDRPDTAGVLREWKNKPLSGPAAGVGQTFAYQ